jgi:hypothetical protein
MSSKRRQAEHILLFLLKPVGHRPDNLKLADTPVIPGLSNTDLLLPPYKATSER